MAEGIVRRHHKSKPAIIGIEIFAKNVLAAEFFKDVLQTVQTEVLIFLARALVAVLQYRAEMGNQKPTMAFIRSIANSPLIENAEHFT
jgi:hypothetical protein